MCSDLFADTVAGHDAFLVPAPARRRVCDRREDHFARDGKPPTTESRRFGERGPLSLSDPGRFERRSAAAVAAGGADRSPQRRRRLDPDPGGVLRPGRAEGGARTGFGGPRRRRQPAGPGWVLTRTVAETAAVLDLLAGYELGDADLGAAAGSGIVRRAAAREPGRLRIGFGAQPAAEAATFDPACERARATPRHCWRRLATASRRSRRRGRTGRSCPTSPGCSGRGFDDDDGRWPDPRPRADARGRRAADVGDVERARSQTRSRS